MTLMSKIIHRIRYVRVAGSAMESDVVNVDNSVLYTGLFSSRSFEVREVLFTSSVICVALTSTAAPVQQVGEWHEQLSSLG